MLKSLNKQRNSTLHVSAVWRRVVVVGAALRLDVGPCVDLRFKLSGVELFEFRGCVAMSRSVVASLLALTYSAASSARSLVLVFSLAVCHSGHEGFEFPDMRLDRFHQ